MMVYNLKFDIRSVYSKIKIILLLFEKFNFNFIICIYFLRASKLVKNYGKTEGISIAYISEYKFYLGIDDNINAMYIKFIYFFFFRSLRYGTQFIHIKIKSLQQKHEPKLSGIFFFFGIKKSN